MASPLHLTANRLKPHQQLPPKPPGDGHALDLVR
jgi:hypothetical protein